MFFIPVPVNEKSPGTEKSKKKVAVGENDHWDGGYVGTGYGGYMGGESRDGGTTAVLFVCRPICFPTIHSHRR